MKPLFADTSYYLALLNADDEYNSQATLRADQIRGRTVTTTWVLTELADALCRPEYRGEVAQFIADLRSDPRVLIAPATEELFEQGLDLFLRRPDKAWSLTDCISFVVMQDRGLTEALTADHHFEQAGFVTLLK